MSTDDITPSPEPSDTGSTEESTEELRRELEAERERIAALEAENAALLEVHAHAAHGNAAGDGTKPKGRRTHRFWIAVLLVIGLLLTPLSIIALFVKGQINDTDRYVQTIKPLASDPAVQAYVAEEVSDQLFERVDIKEYVEDALPNRADVLAGPLTAALQSFVRQAVERILETDQFEALWIDVNRIADSQMVNVLTGETTAGVTANSNGAVTVDLSEVSKLVQEQLESTGIDLFSQIPIANIGGKITIFQSDSLYQARTGLKILNAVALVLPFLVLACFAGAIYLSKNRRKGFVASAVCFMLGAFILGLVLFVGRGLYLNVATSNQLPYDVAAAVYDTLVRFLHTSVRVVSFFSIIVIIAVFFAGPSRFAVWFRDRAGYAASWLGAQSDRGWEFLAPNEFVVKRQKGLRVIVGVIAFLVLFFWKHPTVSIIVYLTALTLLALFFIEFFGRERLPELERDPAGVPSAASAEVSAGGAAPPIATG